MLFFNVQTAINIKPIRKVKNEQFLSLTYVELFIRFFGVKTFSVLLSIKNNTKQCFSF